MGFYSPSQLVQDARRHNITVLPVCINQSHWEHTLEIDSEAQLASPALRLGLRLVKGVSEASALKLMAAREKTPFASINDVKSRSLVSSDELQKLISANAFRNFESNRRQAYWQSLEINNIRHADGHIESRNTAPNLIKTNTPLEDMLADYRSARGVSLDYHPMQLLRSTHPFQRCITADNLLTRRNNSLIEVAGVVTGRQRPGTASGVIFMTLEDETGNINVVLWKGIQERFRREILNSQVLYIKGSLEHQHGVANVVAGYVECQDHALPSLKAKSRDFH